MPKGYLFDQGSVRRIGDVVRFVEGQSFNGIRYRPSKRYHPGGGMTKAFSVTLKPANPDADPPTLASVTVQAGRFVIDGTDLYWDVAKVTDKEINGPTEFAYPTIEKSLEDTGAPEMIIYSEQKIPTTTKIYVPLVRLKSNDGGESWAFDGPGCILYDGDIHLSGTLIFGGVSY